MNNTDLNSHTTFFAQFFFFASLMEGEGGGRVEMTNNCVTLYLNDPLFRGPKRLLVPLRYKASPKLTWSTCLPKHPHSSGQSACVGVVLFLTPRIRKTGAGIFNNKTPWFPTAVSKQRQMTDEQQVGDFL